MEEKIKILLAEDDTNLGMLLKEYLRAKGFETVLCEDGEVAYEAFLNQLFNRACSSGRGTKAFSFSVFRNILGTGGLHSREEGILSKTLWRGCFSFFDFYPG